MSNTTKSSFYNGNDTVYTDTNPPGPSDAPMTSPDGVARSSFYERSGQQYAAIDLADQSVADVENNAALATMMEAYAQSAAGVAGAFARKAQSAWSAIQASIGTVEARLAGYLAGAAQAARQARKEAASGAETVRSALAGYLVAAQNAVSRSRAAAAVAESSSATHAALAANFARQAKYAYALVQSAVGAIAGARAMAEASVRSAKTYSADAYLAYQHALANANVSWGWAKRSAISASAASASATGAANSASSAASSASTASTVAASLTDDQIALKAQVFN